MKLILKITLFLLFAFIMTGCFTQQPISMLKPQNNQTYDLYYLFEHDGCKVYRFYDMGHYVYYTNCNGTVTGISNDSTQHRTVNVIQNEGVKVQRSQ